MNGLALPNYDIQFPRHRFAASYLLSSLQYIVPLHLQITAIPSGFEIQQFAIYADANMTVFILYLKHIQISPKT